MNLVKVPLALTASKCPFRNERKTLFRYKSDQSRSTALFAVLRQIPNVVNDASPSQKEKKKIAATR